jgi:hypothetical protein
VQEKNEKFSFFPQVCPFFAFLPKIKYLLYNQFIAKEAGL